MDMQPSDLRSGKKITAETAWPKVTFEVVGHIEVDDHTFYQIKCALETKPSLSLKWGVHRRLLHLREGLHNFVQSCLGDEYGAVFGEARFARRGGLPGTSARLQGWLEQLALHVNDGTASPTTVAHVLRFFEVPSAPAGATVRALLDFSDMPKPFTKASSPFSTDPDSPSSPCSSSKRTISGGRLANSPPLSASRRVSFTEPADSPSEDHPTFAA